MLLADVVRRHGEEYLARHGSAVPRRHVHAMRAITRCRTGALGGHLARCTACGHEHLLFHSCHHRACSRCGHGATARWIARQRDLLLPAPYFHVVFTLPAELRRVVRDNQRVLLNVLFRSAFAAIAALCRDRRWLGGQIGALAVLHTWSRTLEWHPHVHMLVPAGALAHDGRTWRTPPARRAPFLVPVRALADGFRGRFLHLARRALVTLPHIPARKRWVVFAKPAVQGPERVLDYLGRYVHRTALSDKAITHCDDRSVTFSFNDSTDGSRKAMTLPANEFLRRFLQHVPLQGFHRVRAFGLLHSSQRSVLRRLQLLLAPAPGPVAPLPVHPPRATRCPRCNRPSLVRRRRLSAPDCAIFHRRALYYAGSRTRPRASYQGPTSMIPLRSLRVRPLRVDAWAALHPHPRATSTCTAFFCADLQLSLRRVSDHQCLDGAAQAWYRQPTIVAPSEIPKPWRSLDASLGLVQQAY